MEVEKSVEEMVLGAMMGERMWMGGLRVLRRSGLNSSSAIRRASEIGRGVFWETSFQ
jgi:hypothetical protein